MASADGEPNESVFACPEEVVAQGYYAGEEKSMMPAPEKERKAFIVYGTA
jgi:hypothetical protein